MSEKKPASRTPAAEDTFPELPDDICNAKLVLEDLDIIEQFVEPRIGVFPDGSSYEGTVWANLAHGKGVQKRERGRVISRYEGEWYKNKRQGHGVLEVDKEPSEGGGYRYSGQWKHGKMHGCGVVELYELSTSERYYKGRFFNGAYVEEDNDCDDVSELHSRIAEVAAAKARKFVNKPDEKKKERSFLEHVLTFQDKWKVMFENLEKQIDEKKKESK